MANAPTSDPQAVRVATRFPAAGLPMRLHDINTADGDRIEFALLDKAGGTPADLAVVHVHGKGGNFYGLPFRALGPGLESRRLLQLSVNLRCHDLGYTRTDMHDPDSLVANDVGVGGGWWEKFAHGLEDLAAITRYIREDVGIQRIVLIGHSAGALYSTAYAVEDPSIVATVQLSPLTSNKTNLPVWFPEGADLEAFTNRARRMISEDRGHHILPIDVWYYGISAETFIERVSERDDLWLTFMKELRHPSLVLWGSKESRSSLWSSLISAINRASCVGKEIAGAEHNYIDFEDEVSDIVNNFFNVNDYFQNTV